MWSESRVHREIDYLLRYIFHHDSLSTHAKSVHGLDASISEMTSPPMLGGYRPYTRALLPGLPPVADVKVHQRPGAMITGFLRIANRFFGSDGSEICRPTPGLTIRNR